MTWRKSYVFYCINYKRAIELHNGKTSTCTLHNILVFSPKTKIFPVESTFLVLPVGWFYYKVPLLLTTQISVLSCHCEAAIWTIRMIVWDSSSNNFPISPCSVQFCCFIRLAILVGCANSLLILWFCSGMVNPACL